MSTKKKLLEAAAGNAGGGATYVDDVFSTYLYKGNGSTQTIDNGIDLDGEGGLVWFKNREDGARNHSLFDTETDPTGQRYLISNTAGALNDTGASSLTYSSDGFTLNNGSPQWNGSVDKTVSWTFRKAPGFFDVVTYTGNGSIQNISHNLGTTPGFIIIKSTSNSSTNWSCWHRSIPTSYMLLNSAQAKQSAGSRTVNDSTFQVNSWYDEGANGRTYVAYLFAHDAQEFGTDSDESIIKCGSYTGNGSSTAGPTIDLGFEPQFILQRAVDRTANWYIYDSMRGIVTQGDDTALMPNTLGAEYVAERLALTPSGFQITTTNGNFNQSGENYIYMAIRRPHKPAEEFAATDLFGIDNNTGQTGVNTNVLSDFGFVGKRASTDKWYVGSRLTQGTVLNFSSTAAQSTSSIWNWDQMQGMFKDTGTWNGYIGYGLRRAPGYFDVVAYTGDGTSTSFSHNLGVTPELKIIKIRSDAFGWVVGGSVVTGGTTDYKLSLNTTAAKADTNWWQAIDSASAFSVRSGNFLTNTAGETYIAYLFATVAGISKVGSYTGTAADLNVDCGFSAGARFVLIKRTDSTGDWYVWDSVRGIVAGNDPYLLLNDTAAEVTNTDYIDPLASGFTVTSSAPAGLNASSGTYIFYAIAQEYQL